MVFCFAVHSDTCGDKSEEKTDEGKDIFSLLKEKKPETDTRSGHDVESF